MFDIISQARNAIDTYNNALSVSSSNIANMGVVGYKRLDVSFQSIYEKVARGGTPASTFSNIGGTNPQQYGQGVSLANIAVDFSQGSFVEGKLLDCAISGNGLFIVSTDGGRTYRYTRAGKFYINNGNLVNETGMQVYGLNTSGSLTAITGLSNSEDYYRWNSQTGELEYYDTTSGNFIGTGYRIALTYFPNPSGLQQAEGTTFTETMASGGPASPTAPGGSAGSIFGGQLEQSNVFYLGETIDALEFQRAMSANLSVVTMASEIIQSFISKLG